MPKVQKVNFCKFKNKYKCEKFTENNIKIVRPATGTPIKNYDKIIGKLANKNYSSGDIIYLNL